MPMELTRDQVLRYRVHVQELDRTGAHTDAAILDLGVQDTGGDGAGWALANRGATIADDELMWQWTLRGAPHAYRRRDAAAVSGSVGPWTDRDAAKRIFDASGPLKKADIAPLAALDQIATEAKALVTEPMVKGDVSGALNDRLPEPFRRFCRPCDTIHLYEQTFRLGTMRAGLELQPHTSPPILRPIPEWSGPGRAEPRLDPVRACLHLFGPLAPRHVADYVDTTLSDVKDRWPDDAVEVSVDGDARFALADDLEVLSRPPRVAGVVRLLSPFDPFLQTRDRSTVVPDEARRQELWRTLGRPGAVLVGHEIAGAWRPRQSGRTLRLAIDAWTELPDLSLEAERLAAYRGVTFGGLVDA